MKISTGHRFGRRAETQAAQYLMRQGFGILARNYRYQHTELDIIAQKGKLLVFVEVKARRNISFGYPESFVTPQQSERYLEAADQYIAACKWPYEVRFDIIAVQQQASGMTLTHFEDAF